MTDLPLRGIRVADFGRVVAAPFAAQILGWLGAEVVLVESSRHLVNRAIPPFADGVRGVNRSGAFNLVNTQKMSITLDLSAAQGVEVARKLISISDVVVENYATGVMEGWGLGYDAVQRHRPDIVYLSLASFGRTGPMKDFVGFHSVVNLFSGLASLTGYPGGHPRILGAIFPDLFSGCYGLLAILEALYHRSKTGQGQYIEVSMTEALTTLMPEAVIEHTLTGGEAQRAGNRHKTKAPHNVYPCHGDQKWVAISVSTDAQWKALCRVAAHPEWESDSRFNDSAARRDNQDALDQLLQLWTREREAHEVTNALQATGVAAFPVLDSREILEDPHLNERGFVSWVDHPEAGLRAMGNVSWKLDSQRPVEYSPAPLLGEDNAYVLEELLRLPSDEIARLTQAGILA